VFRSKFLHDLENFSITLSVKAPTPTVIKGGRTPISSLARNAKPQKRVDKLIIPRSHTPQNN
ncbi:MAG: hypothetical protein ACFNS5_04540, partial [Prevotella melaninogenica]